MFLDVKPNFGAMFQLIIVGSTALSHILDTFDTDHNMTMMQVWQGPDGHTTVMRRFPRLLARLAFSSTVTLACEVL